MESVKSLALWFVNNWDSFLLVLVTLVAFLEAVVKITPTKTDDGFVHRIGELIDKLTKLVPSNIKKEEPPKP